MRRPWRSRDKLCAWDRISYFRTTISLYALALQRFDEARQIIQDAQARKMDE